MKATKKITVWDSEYDDQSELFYIDKNGKPKRLTIYRTYGPRSDGKTELYTAERTGNR